MSKGLIRADIYRNKYRNVLVENYKRDPFRTHVPIKISF